MELLVTIIHVITAIFMILVVLIQGGNQGGVGAAFGGGNSQGVFGATGATSFLGKLTYFAAITFTITSISLTIMQGRGGSVGLREKLKQASEQEQVETLGKPAAVPAPEAGQTEQKAGAPAEQPAATDSKEADKPAE